MAPKQDRIYVRGRSKSVAPSASMVIGSDDERDPEYVPPGTSTPSRAARDPRATPKKVVFGVVTASQSNEERTLTDIPSGSNSTSGSPAQAPTQATEQPNRWCVDGQFQVYSDAKFLTDKGVMTQTLTLERWVLTGSLPTMREIHNLFTRHRLEWTTRMLGRYNEEIGGLPPAKQAPQEQVCVRGVQVDISLPTIRRFLFGEGVDATRTPLTAEFDYQWQIVKDGQFMREPSLRETTKKWISLHLSVDGEGANWVTKPKGAIKKANLTFTAKFLWLIVSHCLSPTADDNIVTWDQAVLMAAMIAGFEVDIAWLLQAFMRKRAFKVTTTYPFPCMIFSLCRSAGVPIWHVDQLKTPQGTIDVGHIRDEANELAPHRGPHPELPPLADMVAQARTATQAASSDTTPVESIPGSSTAPSSFRTAPLPAVVPLARVQKLEAQMATLLHHISRRYRKRKIAEVHQCLDAFELRVLARPAPLVDVLTLQATVDSLRVDIDTMLEARVPESEAPSVEPAEDTVLAALFATYEIPPPTPREHAKRRRGREEDEARARKKERQEMEAARKASLAEEEAHQMRASELAAGASTSRTVEIAGGTTDSVVVAEDTTEGVQIAVDVGSAEPDPPTC
ncbi:hypothetical protein EJD97_007496 [Solanum chilense]|uniref:Putative plant transposon protein domain-containing protein n=1 Tax=Solanum chilense TaxID=4083 RepID=A0A6N2AJJ5_SOLCI|nr:hypothetical protein EJD97_007496 [Solanum chilense]